jgi:metal-responsive CopG/Arc/MetJ family transcriptional regulator
MNEGKSKVTIKIPKPLYNNLSEIIKETGFNSVTELIVFILRDIASLKSSKEEKQSLTSGEIEVIRKRLKSLGYL